ncbi:MAG TPA: caspase family protein [Myxococcaceae bacterium]|nr:caspase family protein [Myxococcaceae bacterium]
MSHFAIIIGVDHYDDPAWRLSAAVDDALAFREWALGPGGVPPENVHLLLSPVPGRRLEVPYEPADSEHIIDVIQQFQQGRGTGGARLYFYYAGHGAAAPDSRDEVVIVPSDVRSWRRDARRLIGFSELVVPLRDCGPEAQFFFVDACRDLLLEDFARGVGPVVGRWRGPASGEAPWRRAQYLLYATSPGGRALETGQGVFGRLLLQGLKGAPGALVWCARDSGYELRFSHLAEYVRTEVEAQVKRLGGPWRQFLQVPEQDIPPGAMGPKDFILARFSPQEVGRLSLRVRVQPGPERKLCHLRVLYYAPGGLEFPVESVAPPIPLPVELQLPPGDYTIQATSAQGTARQPCALYRPQAVDLTLQPSPNHRGAPRVPPMLQGPRQLQKTRLPSFTVHSKDPLLPLVISDPMRREYKGFGRVSLSDVPAGIYRARPVLPEGPLPEQWIELHPGGPNNVLLQAPAPRLGAPEQHLLQRLALEVDAAGYLSPADRLGPVAALRLVSLLGFAAFDASSRPPHSRAWRMERLGIQPPSSLCQGGSGLQVLLGASGNQPVPGSSAQKFLSDSWLVLRKASTGRVAGKGTFKALPGLAAAGQWGQPVEPDSWILELFVPNLAPTRYALVSLRNHISILVIVVGDSGEVEVQQYLSPLPDSPPLDWPAPVGLKDLRHVELAQRYLAAGLEIPALHLEQLLLGEHFDPLLACIAGYALARQGPQERFSAALDTLLHRFDGLADTHVLAGLHEPSCQKQHLDRALERGLPLFSEGLRVLQSHVGAPKHRRLAEARRGLLPTSPWTAWLSPSVGRSPRR